MAGIRGVQRGDYSQGTLGDLAQALNIGLATANRTLKQLGQIQSVNIGLGTETGAMELPAFAAEIDADDPSWEIQTWATAENGNLVARNADEVRADIVKRFEPYLVGQNPAYQKGFLDRTLPGIERGIWARGLERREMYLQNQLETMGQGIYSTMATLDHADQREPGSSFRIMNDYLTQVGEDVRRMFPQQVDEPDDAYQSRAKNLIYGKVITPHIGSLIGTKGGMEVLATFSGEIPPEHMGVVRDKVQRAYYEYLHERLATVQAGGPESQFTFFDNYGNVIEVSNESDMQKFLSDPKLLNQDQLLSLTAAQRRGLMGSFTTGNERQAERLQSSNSMQGQGLPGDSRSQFDALQYMNLFDPETGFIGGSSPESTGLLLSTMRYPSVELAGNLLNQAMSRDTGAGDVAIATLVMMAAHPDPDAFDAVADRATTPREQQLMSIIKYQTADSVLFNQDGRPEIDSLRLQKILGRVRLTPISEEGPENTQEEVLNAARIMGLTGWKPENDIQAEVITILKTTAGADSIWPWSSKLMDSNPEMIEFVTNHFIDSAALLGKSTPGIKPDVLKAQATIMVQHQINKSFARITLGNGNATWVPKMSLHPDQKFGDDGKDIMAEYLGDDAEKYYTAIPAINGEGWIPLDEFGDTILEWNQYIDFAGAREAAPTEEDVIRTRKATGFVRSIINGQEAFAPVTPGQYPRGMPQ
tara:strand:- start:413 stop:2518 length:2106 start_codon:yes stop_codon:yes gene_type:complete